MTETGMRVFDKFDLPKLENCSVGYCLSRHDSDCVVTKVPSTVTVHVLADDSDTLVPIEVTPDCWMVVQQVGEFYPVCDFESTYILGEKVSLDEDERAKLLYEFWLERNFQIEMYRAYKLTPVFVIGVLNECGIFDVDGSTEVHFRTGDLLLKTFGESGRIEPITKDKFLEHFGWVGPIKL